MQLQLLERLRDIVETTQNGKFYKITIKSNGNQIVLDNYDDVFVQLFTPDAKMQKSMNGWYKVDHEHRILTNTNGYCLLYENIDVTYNAYRFGKD